MRYLLLGAYEYLTKKSYGHDFDVSRLFIYYNARRDSTEGELTDSGCSMTSAIECLEKHGVCPESVWPYNIERVHEQPSDEAYEIAGQYHITEALKVNIDLFEMKSCLAQGFPFGFGLALFNSFDKASKSGVVRMPGENAQGRESHGLLINSFTSFDKYSSTISFFLVMPCWRLVTVTIRIHLLFEIRGEIIGYGEWIPITYMYNLKVESNYSTIQLFNYSIPHS